MDIIFWWYKTLCPEDWCVQSNLDSVFGGYSDKRPNAAIAIMKVIANLYYKVSNFLAVPFSNL